jgi:hypothetical protein
MQRAFNYYCFCICIAICVQLVNDHVFAIHMATRSSLRSSSTHVFGMFVDPSIIINAMQRAFNYYCFCLCIAICVQLVNDHVFAIHMATRSSLRSSSTCILPWRRPLITNYISRQVYLPYKLHASTKDLFSFCIYYTTHTKRFCLFLAIRYSSNVTTLHHEEVKG